MQGCWDCSFGCLTGFNVANRWSDRPSCIYCDLRSRLFATAPQNANDPPPELILMIVVVVVGIIFVSTLLFAVPKIVAGYGLRKKKPGHAYGRSSHAVWCDMAFPLGTAIGVYGLIFLFGENGRAYFEIQTTAGCRRTR